MQTIASIMIVVGVNALASDGSANAPLKSRYGIMTTPAEKSWSAVFSYGSTSFIARDEHTTMAYRKPERSPNVIPVISLLPTDAVRTPDTKIIPMKATATQMSFLPVIFSLKTNGEISIRKIGSM